MRWQIIFSLLFFIFVIFLLVFYWIIPSTKFAEFIAKPSNFNFTTDEHNNMQYHPNMRFPSSVISYRIDTDCSAEKTVEMEKSFLELPEITVLNFYPVASDEEIYVTCREDKEKEGEFFVAGEGGPTNVIAGKNFNVIFKGKITLLRESDCENSNVGTHELLHVLGFVHSLNRYNIMYNVTNCKQTIGEDIPTLINDIYSYPSLSDLTFANVSAVRRGVYFDVNMTIRNEGLKNSEATKVEIYGNEKMIKDFDLEPIEIGEGVRISFGNILVMQLSISELKIKIISDFEELNKENNNVVLEIKS